MTTWYSFGLVHGFLWLEFDFPGPIDLGNRVQLTKIPAWLRGAAYVPDCTADCVWRILDRRADTPQFAIVHQFDAPGLDDRNPEWKGPEKVSYERSAVDRLMLTTQAVWLIEPGSTLQFAEVLHAMQEGDPRIERWTTRPRLYPGCIPQGLSHEQIEQARALNNVIGSLRRSGPLWMALRALWRALTEGWFHNRYLLLWIALEALFGPRDSREVTHRLSQNLALFLESEPEKRATVFRRAKKDYGVRSQIAHGEGGRIAVDEFNTLVDRAQDWVRQALFRILTNVDLRRHFSTPEARDDFFQAALLRVTLR